MNSLSDKDAADGEGLQKLNETVWPLGGGAGRSSTADGESGVTGAAPGMIPFNSANQGEGEGISATAGLGDLAGLTVANESENGGTFGILMGHSSFLPLGKVKRLRDVFTSVITNFL